MSHSWQQSLMVFLALDFKRSPLEMQYQFGKCAFNMLYYVLGCVEVKINRILAVLSILLLEHHYSIC